MTVDEIKEAFSMREIVERYGFHPNRVGFIQCPFHTGDRQASMKIYRKDYHCHACGAHGDIFDFVRKMDNLSFKEAYLQLGGEYNKLDFKGKLRIYKAKKQREHQLKKDAEEDTEIKLLSKLIEIYKNSMKELEPLSDEWCKTYNKLQLKFYKYEYLVEKRWKRKR